MESTKRRQRKVIEFALKILRPCVSVPFVFVVYLYSPILLASLAASLLAWLWLRLSYQAVAAVEALLLQLTFCSRFSFALARLLLNCYYYYSSLPSFSPLLVNCLYCKLALTAIHFVLLWQFQRKNMTIGGGNTSAAISLFSLIFKCECARGTGSSYVKWSGWRIAGNSVPKDTRRV